MRVRKNADLLTADEWERFCNPLVALKHRFPGGQSPKAFTPGHLSRHSASLTQSHPNQQQPSQQ